MGTSSTAREMFAVLLGLKAFRRNLFGEEVAWHCDNQAAVAIMTKGSTKKNLQEIAQEIWNFCADASIHAEFFWVAREFNVEADEASRIIDLDDWSVTDEVFSELEDAWGTCTIDTFASSVSSKCEKFISRAYDPSAVSFNAFASQSLPWWTNEFAWWVPPPYLIARTVIWAKKNHSKGILGFPMWASHLFFGELREKGKWISEIKKITIFPAGSPILKGNSQSYTFKDPFLSFDFAFCLLIC